MIKTCTTKHSILDIWRFEEDFQITKEDLPYLKKAIKLLGGGN